MLRFVELNPGVIMQFSFKTESGYDHTFLSNGFIEPDGTFVEREYQAAKAFDPAEREIILACAKPFGEGGSKQLGRAAKLRPDWERVKFQIMAQLVLAKFLDHPNLAEQLLATRNTFLIEGNDWHDNVWGDCHCGRPECVVPGMNWLGQILMTVRESIRRMPR